MNGGWIQTFTGRHVYLPTPAPASFAIEDIAHGLSQTCRYTGQCKEPYSVAQHSVIVSRYLRDDLKLAGLLHDAPEAYLSDIHGVVKPFLPDYCALEAVFMQAIATKFKIPYPLSPEIKLIDRRVLATEVRDLVTNPWDIQGRIEAKPLGELPIIPQPPREAEGNFLEEFWKLCK